MSIENGGSAGNRTQTRRRNFTGPLENGIEPSWCANFRPMCRSEESNLIRHTFLRPSSPAKLVLPVGFNPTTSAFEAGHSIH